MALYLVTGIAGFIGSALAHALVERGESVRGIDDLSTGKRENLAGILDRIDLREVSILEERAVRDACAGVDYVLHHAAIASVVQSISDPIGNHRVNVDGTVNVLTAAKDTGVKRVVFAGSSAAYGDTATLPNHEALPANPLSPYAATKVAGEAYMRAFYRSYGLSTVTLRYFNVFGPRQDPSSPYPGVLARFISQMLGGEPPTIFGDGEQSRDFIFVDDVVAANLAACAAREADAAGQTFNIATGSRTSLKQVFQTLQPLTGYSGTVRFGPERAGDIKHSEGDISAARRCLGFKPTVGFQEGLRRTVAWYRGRL